MSSGRVSGAGECRGRGGARGSRTASSISRPTSPPMRRGPSRRDHDRRTDHRSRSCFACGMSSSPVISLGSTVVGVQSLPHPENQGEDCDDAHDPSDAASQSRTFRGHSSPNPHDEKNPGIQRQPLSTSIETIRSSSRAWTSNLMSSKRHGLRSGYIRVEVLDTRDHVFETRSLFFIQSSITIFRGRKGRTQVGSLTLAIVRANNSARYGRTA